MPLMSNAKAAKEMAMSRRVTFLVLLLLSFVPCYGSAQDAFAEHRVNGLKGLRNVALVIRANTPHEVFTLKEWADLVELGLQRNAPDLTVLEPKASQNWLELSVVTTDQGAVVEVSLLRWVKVLASGQEVIAKVWSQSRMTFGGVSKNAMRESIDTLLTSFAADYARSKRR
jgi:hypothetical protein